MQTGTLTGYAWPLKRQVFISGDRVLSTQELNGLILVNSAGGPVTITLPRANTIRAGGFFQILALTGNVFPVTVRLSPGAGDFYNTGVVADIVLSSAAQALLVAATESASQWIIPLNASGSPPTGPARGDLGLPGGAPTPASGNYPNPTVVAVQNRRVDPAAPLFGQALLWNGLSWAPNFVAVSPNVFGAEVLPAAGPFFLPPGFDLSGTALPATEIPIKATQNQNLRFLHIQQTPGVGGGTVTYTVFVGGVATALAVTLPLTGTDANNVVALPFASSNSNISVQVDYTGAVVTPPSRATVNFQAVAA